MKKIIVCLFAALQVICLCACSAQSETGTTVTEETSAAVRLPQTAKSSETESKKAEKNEKGVKNMRIAVTDENSNTVVFELNDSKAAAELYSQLPLFADVENFSNNEKIFYPKVLDVSGAPHADKGAGTLAYYSPWGNVVMFYGDYQQNSGLYELGKAVNGAEYIKDLSGRIEIVKYTSE